MMGSKITSPEQSKEQGQNPLVLGVLQAKQVGGALYAPYINKVTDF